MPGPIRPNEVNAKKAATIPEVVFEAFNELIAKHWNGHMATFYQDDAIENILAKDPHLTRQQIFAEHMLDVEEAYRQMGWEVHYDKPAYNETGRPTFRFIEPKK